MGGLKWTRKSTVQIALQLRKEGIEVCAGTVRRLLRKMSYSLRVNCKKLESGNRNPPSPKKRDQQFRHIAQIRQSFTQAGQPVISIDTKKKELIGNFKKEGRTWRKDTIDVFDHDFRTDASALAVPFGILDDRNNRGLICVGTSAETPALAVDAIEYWWVNERPLHFPDATRLLILADCGGANGHRLRVFKWRLQQQLCQKHQVTLTLCHYPPGASKWNPIEHRLFAEITKNWHGQPLLTLGTMFNYIRTTRTKSGLHVNAHWMRKKYEKGERVSDRELDQVPIQRDKTLPEWNYVIAPRNGEVILA